MRLICLGPQYAHRDGKEDSKSAWRCIAWRDCSCELCISSVSICRASVIVESGMEYREQAGYSPLLYNRRWGESFDNDELN
jgi:hypothetical protein